MKELSYFHGFHLLVVSFSMHLLWVEDGTGVTVRKKLSENRILCEIKYV